MTTAWLCTPGPGWCRRRCLLQPWKADAPGGRCLGSGLLLLPPTGAPRLMQRLTVPEPGRTAEETVRSRVLPTGDSSAGLPCVGLGRNESGLKNVYFQRGLNRNLTKASRNNFKQISQNSFEKKWVQVDGMRTIKGQIGIARK